MQFRLDGAGLSLLVERQTGVFLQGFFRWHRQAGHNAKPTVQFMVLPIREELLAANGS